MSITDFQETLIDTITNITAKHLSKSETIGEYIGVEDMEWDGDDVIWVVMKDGSEFELKIRKP
jgi:hypothetical protein